MYIPLILWDGNTNHIFWLTVKKNSTFYQFQLISSFIIFSKFNVNDQEYRLYTSKVHSSPSPIAIWQVSGLKVNFPFLFSPKWSVHWFLNWMIKSKAFQKGKNIKVIRMLFLTRGRTRMSKNSSLFLDSLSSFL